MKAIYIEAFAGISGNMLLGALIDAGVPFDYLASEMKKLHLGEYELINERVNKCGIDANYFNVLLPDECQHDVTIGHQDEHTHAGHHHHEHGDTGHNHEHHSDCAQSCHQVKVSENLVHHHHEHRNLHDIAHIIAHSDLHDKIKMQSLQVFTALAEAEAKVHGKTVDEVHFHEVGAIDSIVDIVGTAILINKINPDRIISSVVNDGYGFIECAHGTMAVPVPATSEIFAASNVKFRQIDIDTELVTPTGAAIIAELAEDFTTLPAMVTEKIGWGTGSKDLKIPNVLKVYYGEMQEENQNFVVMETNIDDCSGEILGYTSEKLFANGALDVFYTPIFMKKNRPAYRLSVACRKEDMFKLQNIIFKETTTIGIRYRFESRTELGREFVEIDTKYGKIRAKKVTNNGETYVYPEYESMKKIAEENNIPLKELYKLEELK